MLLGAATSDLDAPEVRASLDNFEETTAEFRNTAVEATGVANDAHRAADLGLKHLQEALKPENKALSFLKFLLGNVETGAAVWYYFTH